MTDVRELLERALLPGTPPMTITRESAIRAGRRALRRRHALITGTFAIVALAVVAVATALLHTIGSSTLPAHPTEQPTEILVTVPPDPRASIISTASAPAFPQTLRPLTEPTATAVARLTTLTQTWSARYLTGFNISSYEVGAPLTFKESNGLFAAGAALTDRKGTGQLVIYLSARGSRTAVPDFNTICQNNPYVLTCESRIGPHGEHIVIYRTPVGDDDKHQRMVVVDVSKADGSEIEIESSSMPPGAGASTSRTEPPLDSEQMLALVLDPAFTLYP
jgi:hypothetical protein